MLFLATCCSYSNAQTADTTSGNLIDSSQWGITYGADPGGCCASISGSAPLYDTTTGVIMYSYGQNTISQTIGINQALGGTGIQVSGYTYNWDYRLVSNSGNANDVLTANISLKNSSGATVESRDFSYTGSTHDVWHTESGTTTFGSAYTDPESISLSFSGKDGGFWAGYYGPELRNISLRLNYSSAPDPCITDPLSSISCPGYAEAYKSQQCSMDPLYDSTCPGYAEAYFNQQCGYNPLYDAACPGNSAVITSGNLVPNGDIWTRATNQSYAINTALSHGGAGLQIHAFRWGFQTFGSRSCFLWIICQDGEFKSDVNITDSNGNSIYSFSTGWQNAGLGYNDRSYYYQLPQSRNNLTLGTFEYTAEVSGTAAVGNFWARMLYTPDQCSLDPLSSPLCTGYEAAFLAQQCSIYVMYSPQCPGYAEALQKMLDEQALLASATETTADPVASTTSSTVSSTPGTAEDPTKDQAAVTTDVGGAEITTTGEVVAADGVPSDVKEAVKESASTEKKEETQTATVTATAKKKPGAKVNALAIAQSAARDAERTALSVSEQAAAASLSDDANPTDGVGLGSGIAIPGLSILQGFGNGSASAQADNQAISQTQIRTQRQEQQEQQTTASATDNSKKDNPLAQANNTVVTAVEQKDDTGKQGPSVRRGGAVDGMSGGDINGLAAAPANFNDYLTQQMTDAEFYASKDIYRGQRNVDNVRALRGLGTDRLHEEMVNQQYNQGAR